MPNMIVPIIAGLVCAATLIGGYFALRFKDKLHLLTGFSAGAVLAIAFLDLLPEAAELAGSLRTTATVALCATVIYMIVDRWFFSQSHSHSVHQHSHGNSQTGSARTSSSTMRAGSLVLHSFLDGLVIGFGFQVSVSIGIAVALAVLAHDFSDGINTVAAVIRHGSQKAKRWLVADALAPVLGITIGSATHLGSQALGVVLSIFAGFFTYIALADLVPESFHAHPKRWTTIATVVGAVFIAIVIAIGGH